jgi:hypothetical protein
VDGLPVCNALAARPGGPFPTYLVGSRSRREPTEHKTKPDAAVRVRDVRRPYKRRRERRSRFPASLLTILAIQAFSSLEH